MDIDGIAQFTLQIDNSNISARRLNATTVKLKGELSRLNPVELNLQRESASPEGTMSAEAFTLGALVLSVLPDMVPTVLDYLRDWCFRNKDHTITIKKRVGEEEIEVSFPQDLSSERLQRLLSVVSSSIDHPSSNKQQ